MHNRPLLCNQTGVILLMTLTVITLLLSLTFALNRQARTVAEASGASDKRIMLLNMTETGIQAGMAILIQDKTASEIDSIQEDWANPDRLNLLLADLPFDDGNLGLTIIDEQGKIQINALTTPPNGKQFNEFQHQIWQRLIDDISTALNLDADSDMILNALKDWMDFDDDDAVTGFSGAESDYYQKRIPPYPCKNRPVDHVSELLLIKGVTRQLFDGTDKTPGLARYVTAGPESLFPGRFGRININTADLPVLSALLPPEKSHLAQEMIEYRSQKSQSGFVNDLSNPMWYKRTPGLSNAVIPSSHITVSSDIYRIRSKGVIDNFSLTVSVVVIREKDNRSGKYKCRIIYRESDL